MSVDDLIRLGKLKREPKARRQAGPSMKLARKSLKTAHHVLAIDHDWALIVAYTAALQATRALMFHEGLRPVHGDGAHDIVVQFGRLRLTEFSPARMALFDKLRRERHLAHYDAAGIVTAREAAEAVEFAKEILAAVERHLAPSGGQP